MTMIDTNAVHEIMQQIDTLGVKQKQKMEILDMVISLLEKYSDSIDKKNTARQSNK